MPVHKKLLDLLRESFPGFAGKRFTLTKKHSRKKFIESELGYEPNSLEPGMGTK